MLDIRPRHGSFTHSKALSGDVFVMGTSFASKASFYVYGEWRGHGMGGDPSCQQWMLVVHRLSSKLFAWVCVCVHQVMCKGCGQAVQCKGIDVLYVWTYVCV